jgi:hypothetical protein
MGKESVITHQDERMTDNEDLQAETAHVNNNGGTEVDPQDTVTLNSYTKLPDPEAAARRIAARQRKEQIYQEILVENQREQEEAKKSIENQIEREPNQNLYPQI